MREKVIEYRGKINYKEAINVYFKTDKDHSDIIDTLKKDFKIKKKSLLQQIIDMSIEYDLKIISRYQTMMEIKDKFKVDGTPVMRGKVTYAFQDRKTLEVYANIILDQSPFESTAKVYDAITNFNFLQGAKAYSLSVANEELTSFSGKTKQGELDGIVYINGVEIDKEKIQSNHFTKNMNINDVVIPIMHGFEEDIAKENMICLIDKNLLSRVGPTGLRNTSFDLHHIKVVNGGSDNKSKDSNGKKIEPSNYLLEVLLKFDANKIKDLMGTIAINQTAHKFRHIQWGSEQGVEVYAVHELPFCLQSEENYNKIINYFGIVNDEGYNSFIRKQMNDKTPREYYHKDRIILIDNISITA